MLIIDAHLDLSMNALQWNRDLRQSVYTIRTQEKPSQGKGRGLNTVAFPEMRQGRVALSFATLLARSTGHPVEHIDYASTAQSFGMAHGQMAYYRALEQQGECRIITNKKDLKPHIAEWQEWDAGQADIKNTPPLGFVISMEGADPILEPKQLEYWHDLGLRLLGPTHYGPGRYAGGTGTELGLTDLGKPLLKEMQRLGIVLDLTHMSDQAFWEALEHYEGLVIASHNNCRSLVAHQRQFTDDQIKAICERNGVIGVAFDSWMLKANWTPRNNKEVTLEDVVKQIDHICTLAGNCNHAAIGTDLDGGFGREQSPYDLDTIVDLQRLPKILKAIGYSETDLNNLMHVNWLRLLNQAWS